MAPSRDEILAVLAKIGTVGGGDLIARDLVRALVIDGDQVRFVLEAATPAEAQALAPAAKAAEDAIRALPGVAGVQVVMTAHGPAAKPAPPSLKIGQHPTAHQGGPGRIAGWGVRAAPPSAAAWCAGGRAC